MGSAARAVLEGEADDVHPAAGLRQARDRVLLGLEDGQDDGLVDRIPLVDQSGEPARLTGDARADRVLDALVAFSCSARSAQGCATAADDP